jgi:hypothetical protein
MKKPYSLIRKNISFSSNIRKFTNGGVATLYMTNGLFVFIYGEIFDHFLIY